MAKQHHTATDMPLPDGLRLGAMLSAHEVEGADYETDWWHWEQRPGHIRDATTSDPAADHWNRYQEDCALARKLGIQVMVRAISWARVMPTPDGIDAGALSRYADEMRLLRDSGIDPVVALWHVALPHWFTRAGGWRNPQAVSQFEHYTRAVCDALGDAVQTWIPLLDPMHWLQQAAWRHRWPGNLEPWHVRRVAATLARAQDAAARILRAAGNADTRVGGSTVTQAFVPEDVESVWDLRFARYTTRRYGRDFVQSLKEPLDFLLVSDGGRQALRLAPLAPANAFSVPVGERVPLGLSDTLALWGNTSTPLWYGGCLVPHADDAARAQRIHADLRALAGGHAKCQAYLHRGFLDGFAWDRGHLDRYGIVHVAADDRARTPNDSAYLLKDAADHGALRAGAVTRFVPDGGGTES